MTTGCQSQYTWSHGTKNTQQFYSDNSRCLAMGNSITAPQPYSSSLGMNSFGNGFVSGMNQASAAQSNRMRDEIYNQCMQGEGWSLSKVQRPSRPQKTKKNYAKAELSMPDDLSLPENCQADCAYGYKWAANIKPKEKCPASGTPGFNKGCQLWLNQQ